MLGMVILAAQYGGIDCEEEYLRTIPEGSEFRIIFDAIGKCVAKEYDEAWSMSEQLLACGSADGYTIQGSIAMDQGDSIPGLALLHQAASHGSSLAELTLAFNDCKEGMRPDMEHLTALAEKHPVFYLILAKIYRGEVDGSLRNERKAIQCLLKADEKGFLGRRGADWLLFCQRQINPSLSESDIRRLQILAGKVDDTSEVICDTLVSGETMAHPTRGRSTEWHR